MHFKISKCQCKFTTSGELVILPSLEIAIYTKTRIPLCHRKQIIAIFGKIFISTTAASLHTIRNFIIPVKFKNELLTGFNGAGVPHASLFC